MEVGLSPGHTVLYGPSSHQRGTAAPNFRLMSIVAKRLDESRHHFVVGMEVGLGPGHIVLDGDPAPPTNQGTAPPPIFGPCLLWSNGWMDRDATWYGGKPQTRQHCVRWGPRSPKWTGAEQPPFSKFTDAGFAVRISHGPCTILQLDVS